jgi:hypothetical protein
MKKFKSFVTVTVMLAAVTACFAYFSEFRHAGKDTVFYMSSSTQKFVNHWLEEGPADLKFVMYEDFPSIEFNSLSDREAYVSYPPGSVVPPYLAARILGLGHVDVQFMQAFMKLWFLLSTLLAAMVFYCILAECMKCGSSVVTGASSVILAVAWMLMPVNLLSMRNLYFADQCVIPLVFMFILAEVYLPRFRNRAAWTGYAFNVFRFALSLCGVLTDYYFLSVIFVAWLIRIVPLFSQERGRLKSIIAASWIYVLPVVAGLGLFALQVSTVRNGWELLLGKLVQRTYSHYDSFIYIGDGSLTVRLLKQYASTYRLSGAVFTLVFTVAVIYNIVLYIKGKRETVGRFVPMAGISLLVFVPPVIHTAVLLNHTVNHGFAMMKFAFPLVYAMLLTAMYAGYKYRRAFFPALAVMLSLAVVSIHRFRELKRYNTVPNITELSVVIGENCSYSDVCFCFTDSIPANPPMQHVISEKRVYHVKSKAEIYEKFPNLDSNARILLVVEADGDWKSPEIRAIEDSIIRQAAFRFESEHYSVYELNREIKR